MVRPHPLIANHEAVAGHKPHTLTDALAIKILMCIVWTTTTINSSDPENPIVWLHPGRVWMVVRAFRSR